MSKIEAWIGQVTTGHGMAGVIATLLAALSGQVSWTAAVPLLLGSVVLIIWPENTKLVAAVQQVAGDVAKAAPPAVADIGAVQSAYLTGVAHGNAAATPAQPAVVVNTGTAS